MIVSHLCSVLKGDFCSLQSIGLGGNDIHDEGALHLAKALKVNKQLKSLGLGGNQVADEGGREIAEMLKVNHTVRKLLLSSNLLGDNAIENMAEALAFNSGLEMLLLADNPFGDEGGRQLAAVLCSNNRSLRVLDIHGTRMSKSTEKEVCSPVSYRHTSVANLSGNMGTDNNMITSFTSFLQIALELHQFSNLTKLGSNFGAEPISSHVAEARGNAQKQARQRQEQRFRQQAPTTSSIGAPTSQLSPSHLY